MIKKFRELKALMVTKIDTFRKSLLFELLFNSKRWTLSALFFGLVAIFLNLSTASLILPSMMRVLGVHMNELSVLKKMDSFFSKFLVIDNNYYFWFFFCVGILMFLKSFFMFVREVLGGKLISKHGFYLKEKTFKHFASKELSFFVREGTGLATSTLNHFNLGAMLCPNHFLSIINNGSSLLFCLFLMLWISWPLFLLVCVVTYPLYWIHKKLRLSQNQFKN
jgi:ABC-type multidrug transport system fused ATPase/permease subunit